jgi:hypothetical protein
VSGDADVADFFDRDGGHELAFLRGGKARQFNENLRIGYRKSRTARREGARRPPEDASAGGTVT